MAARAMTAKLAVALLLLLHPGCEVGALQTRSIGPPRWTMAMQATPTTSGALAGCVACVTGATRGIGRGIALGLAEQGAIVYISGRSLNASVSTEKELGGSLESVAAEIASMGGLAIPVQVDHRVDSQVEELFSRIESEQGRLDVLVNNAFQVPSNPHSDVEDKGLLFRPFWEQPGWFWDTFMTVGLRSHYVASVYAVPLMAKTAQAAAAAGAAAAAAAAAVTAPAGAVVGTAEAAAGTVAAIAGTPAAGTVGTAAGTAGTGRKPLIVHVSSWGGTTYSFNVAYGIGKAGVDRMAADMHIELQASNMDINCVSIYPGIVRTERMRDMLDSGEWEERSKLNTPKCFIESPELTGKAIAALYASDDASQNSGKVVVTAELAKKYSIVDPLSGITPPSIRSLKFLIPSVLLGKIAPDIRDTWEERLIKWSPDVFLPMFVMAEPRPE
jgi:dehydrogenase/reductase SDR family protein 1